MRFLSSWRPPHRVGVIGVTLAMAAAGGFASPALAGPAAAAKRVSATPANGTPHLVRTSGKGTENVRQLVKCGSRMYAVGKFTKIAKGGKTYARNNIFSFKATAPYTVSGLRVGVNGQVNTIAFTKRHGCRDAYLGGVFTSVHGTAAKNIVEVSTSTGAVVQRFGHNASGQVETLLGYRNHLLEGGDFTSTNDDGRPYYASLNPVTGQDDGFVGVRVSGNIPKGPTKVYNQQLSHNGKRLLVEGDFTSVGGLPRQQIFMLNVSGPQAKVSAWTSPEFDQKCNLSESFYVRAAAWSPGDSTVYVADTGLHPRSWNNTFPLTGLCDAVAAFPAAAKAVHHDWIEYSGCDSYYSVAADSSAVYAAGHMRWADNPRGCNHAGPGAVPDQGLQGLSPGHGKAELNSRGKGLYSMSRANADDLLVTGAGLWVASSNRFGSGMCGGVSGHIGICLLPYR